MALIARSPPSQHRPLAASNQPRVSRHLNCYPRTIVAPSRMLPSRAHGTSRHECAGQAGVRRSDLRALSTGGAGSEGPHPERILCGHGVPPEGGDPAAASPGARRGEGPPPAARALCGGHDRGGASDLDGRRLSLVGAPEGVAAPVAALGPPAPAAAAPNGAAVA